MHFLKILSQFLYRILGFCSEFPKILFKNLKVINFPLFWVNLFVNLEIQYNYRKFEFKKTYRNLPSLLRLKLVLNLLMELGLQGE